MAENANTTQWRAAIIAFAKKYKVPQITTNVVIAALMQEFELSNLTAEFYNKPNDGLVSGAEFRTQAIKYLTDGPGKIYTCPSLVKVDPKFEPNVELAVTIAETTTGYTPQQLLSSLITKGQNWKTSIWVYMGINDPNAFQDFLSRKMADALMAEVAKDMQRTPPDIAEILAQELPNQSEYHDDIARDLLLHLTGIFATDEGPKTPAYLILGPAECGATRLANTIAQISLQADLNAGIQDAEKFTAQNRVLILDGSNYTQDHSPSKLMGSFKEYIAANTGGDLSNFVSKPGRKVVVIENIDCANANIQDIVASLIRGKTVKTNLDAPIDAGQTIFIFTAPAIYDEGCSKSGADNKEIIKKVKGIAHKALTTNLHDAAIRRTMVFLPDTNTDPTHLIETHIYQAQKSLAKRGITLNISDRVKQYLVKEYETYLGEIGQKSDSDHAKSFMEERLLMPIAYRIASREIADGTILNPIVNREGLAILPPTHTPTGIPPKRPGQPKPPRATQPPTQAGPQGPHSKPPQTEQGHPPHPREQERGGQ